MSMTRPCLVFWCDNEYGAKRTPSPDQRDATLHCTQWHARARWRWRGGEGERRKQNFRTSLNSNELDIPRIDFLAFSSCASVFASPYWSPYHVLLSHPSRPRASSPYKSLLTLLHPIYCTLLRSTRRLASLCYPAFLAFSRIVP